MCGIYLTNKKFSEFEITQKLDKIKYRGPDYTGYLSVGDLSFGHLRLAIVDLDKRSNQPMSIEDCIIVFNGEIYNFIDIRTELVALGQNFITSGDTEVVLRAYLQWGKEFVNRLNGMFAFAIYNKSENKIFCSRDRLGVKPFYYSWNGSEFEICSQIKPMSTSGVLNEEAISIYLDCTYIPSPYTIYKDIHKLQPGNNLEIDLIDNSICVERYWSLGSVKLRRQKYKDSVRELHLLLKDAVKIRLISDVSIGTFLSSGIDSALVTSLASEISGNKVTSFCIGFNESSFDESDVASKFSKVLKTQHIMEYCSAEDVLKMIPDFFNVYDEPFADSSALPSLMLNKLAKNYVTVAISGDGGDESFLGYNHFKWIRYLKLISFVPLFVYNILLTAIRFVGLKNEKLKTIVSVLKLRDFNRIIESVFIGFNSIVLKRSFDWLEQYKSFKTHAKNPIQRCADLNISLWLENDSNVKVDRASMAFSVEVRSPFLDYRVIEFARSLPVSYRYRRGVRKKILKDILINYIPSDIFDLPKKGFAIPLAEWIRCELRDEILSTLVHKNLTVIPNLDINKFNKMMAEHMSGKDDYKSYIWRVYVIVKWMKINGHIID